MSRTTAYDRAKGPKVQARTSVSDLRVSVNGLSELAAFDSIFVLDTNTRRIDGDSVSATAVVSCSVRSLDDGTFKVSCEPRVEVIELHGVPGNPELLGVLKIANDISASTKDGVAGRFAIVTDSELGSHQAISSRSAPIYGEHYLPPEFELMYASSDTGREVKNRIIRFCDRVSSDFLDQLEAGTLPPAELRPLAEDPSVRFVFRTRTGLETVNPVVSGARFEEGSTVQLYGRPRLDPGEAEGRITSASS